MSKDIKVKMGPTTRRIFNLSKEHLLKHYALILNKASTLSSSQRKTVEYRIGYGINNGTITQDEIQNSLQELDLFVAQKVTDKLNNKPDGSSTEE